MVEHNRLFGCDMRKWYITKHAGWWTVCPPRDGTPGWSSRGGVFKTGAEALTAFAEGNKQYATITTYDSQWNKLSTRYAVAESRETDCSWLVTFKYDVNES